jgi:hypothetical protein
VVAAGPFLLAKPDFFRSKIDCLTLPALSPQKVLWNKMFLEQKPVKAYG